MVKGNLISAETNLRLALTSAPRDPKIQAELKAVIAKRHELWRASGGRGVR